jgi:hypothetical protein
MIQCIFSFIYICFLAALCSKDDKLQQLNQVFSICKMLQYKTRPTKAGFRDCFKGIMLLWLLCYCVYYGYFGYTVIMVNMDIMVIMVIVVIMVIMVIKVIAVIMVIMF